MKSISISGSSSLNSAPEKLDLLRLGVKLEDGLTAPAIVDLVEYDHEKNLSVFNITIHEVRIVK
jgi:16S rRNA U516 pseudouridylate synthase RsuA-like enzyme